MKASRRHHAGHAGFRSVSRLVLGVLLPVCLTSFAYGGFTQTLPQGMFILDESYAHTWLDQIWDNDGKAAPLMEDVQRYDPGGGKQGAILPKPFATYDLLISKLQAGVTDDLTLGIGIPVVLQTYVDPHLEWEEGDYQRAIGRAYTEEDFWAWAESMGQTRPQAWTGNKGVLSDIVLGLRWRFSHYLPAVEEAGVGLAFSFFGAIPTGRPAAPEDVVSGGTTMWELHSQGDLGFHLSVDKTFLELDSRLTLGLDVFYEVFLPRRYTTPTGEKNPLLLTYAPYVGSHYSIEPGDFAGFSFLIEGVPYKGPTLDTWLTRMAPEAAANLPPILSMSLMYTFTHIQQSDWRSESARWNWEQEKWWRPGYKNILTANLTLSLLRVGAPLQFYVTYRTLTLIPGKNTRAADMVSAGIQIPFAF